MTSYSRNIVGFQSLSSDLWSENRSKYHIFTIILSLVTFYGKTRSFFCYCLNILYNCLCLVSIYIQFQPFSFNSLVTATSQKLADFYELFRGFSEKIFLCTDILQFEKVYGKKLFLRMIEYANGCLFTKYCWFAVI
jgi:hypothetical protein